MFRHRARGLDVGDPLDDSGCGPLRWLHCQRGGAWAVPDVSRMEPIPIQHPQGPVEGETFLPYGRDELLARPWAIPERRV